MRLNFFHKTAILSLFLISNILISNISLADFDPNFIISDEDLLNKDAMTADSIQSFLVGKNSTLASYTCLAQGKGKDDAPITETIVTTGQAIYDISQRWGINPKFILATLQKEQSLIEDTAPSQKQYDWATGYAVCDNCSLDDPAIQRWKGFYRQVNSAAAQFEYYMEHPNKFRFQKNKAYTIDSTSVTPANDATAAMYNYTPHLRGNQNFVAIWTRWFSKHYPDGSLVQVPGDAGVWYIQYGTRRPIKSKAALSSRFNSAQIIPISATDLEGYPTGWPITLPNYSLVRSPRKDIYLIVDDERRLVSSMTVFKKIGWNPEEVIDVAQNDLDNFFEGESITEKSIYPDGALLQAKNSIGVYFVKDGVKYPIIAEELLKLNFPNKKIIKTSATELDGYTLGDPIKLKDGVLVRSKDNPSVYVISNGARRPITSEEIFLGLGYKWSNVVVVPENVLDLSPLSDPLSI